MKKKTLLVLALAMVVAGCSKNAKSGSDVKSGTKSTVSTQSKSDSEPEVTPEATQEPLATPEVEPKPLFPEDEGTVMDITKDQRKDAAKYIESLIYTTRGEFDAESVRDRVGFVFNWCHFEDNTGFKYFQGDESGDDYAEFTLEYADELSKRKFGIGITEEEAREYKNDDTYPASQFKAFDGTYFIFNAPGDGEMHTLFPVVRQIEERVDGTQRILYDLYDYGDEFVPDEKYAMTAEEAEDDPDIEWNVSGLAIVTPYDDNGKATYQLSYLKESRQGEELTEEAVVKTAEKYSVKKRKAAGDANAEKIKVDEYALCSADYNGEKIYYISYLMYSKDNGDIIVLPGGVAIDIDDYRFSDYSRAFSFDIRKMVNDNSLEERQKFESDPNYKYYSEVEDH